MEDRGDDATTREALVFLARYPHVFLLTRRADGFPTAYAMTARVIDGCVLFSTYGASAKVLHLLREGRARVLSSDDEAGGTVVEVGGPVRLVEAGRWLDPVSESTPGGTRGMGPVPAEIGEQVRRRHESGKRVVVELRVTYARLARSAS